jgi:hypothetical protein
MAQCINAAPPVMPDPSQGLPDRTLYHYTSLLGLQQIIELKALWATNAHYLNDLKEIQHAQDTLAAAIGEGLRRTRGQEAEILLQLRSWLAAGANRHQIYICSFTEGGNLLSQWRAYTPHGLGVSLGFPAPDIVRLAEAQGYRLAQCIYDEAQQARMIGALLDAIVMEARRTGPTSVEGTRHGESYYPVFEKFTDELLMHAAVMKHGSFREEHEWRAISPVFRDLADPSVLYRVGRFTLIPYRNFGLVAEADAAVVLDEVIVGPSASIELSMQSIPAYLASRGVSPRSGVKSSGIPYRG